jgi:phosphohistidine phosphatase SixA
MTRSIGRDFLLSVVALTLAGLGPAPQAAGAAPAAGRPTAADMPGGANGPALVVLVRHAEKAPKPAADPPLSAAGKVRAAALATALKEAGVTAIVTSGALRAIETAAPLAEMRGLKPIAIPFRSGGVPAQVEAVATEVRRQTHGVVVVVGHSNTIPLIIAALGGPHLPDIPETEYAHLFMLVPGPGAPHLVQTLYGAPDGG